MIVGLLLTGGFVVQARASTDEKEEDDNEFREDVIVCEEAVAHAIHCCGFKVQGDACRFYHYSSVDSCGCDSHGDEDGASRVDVRPVVSIEEGRHIAGTECDAMRKPGAGGKTECERVYAMLQRENDSSFYRARNCR